MEEELSIFLRGDGREISEWPITCEARRDRAHDYTGAFVTWNVQPGSSVPSIIIVFGLCIVERTNKVGKKIGLKMREFISEAEMS